MQILLGLLLCLVAGLIPVAIYGSFVNWLDQHEKEPWQLLSAAFVWGAIPAVFVAIIAQLILEIPTTWVVATDSLIHEVVGGSLWAPLTEEITKGVGVVAIILLARRELDNLLDGIIYGAMAGLGFAFTENLLYFAGALIENGWGGWMIVVLLRTIPFGLNHAFFSGLAGAGLALAFLSRNLLVKTTAPLGGLILAMTFHGLHNLGVALAAENSVTLCLGVAVNWGGIILLGVVIALIWKQERGWMAEHLPGEVTEEVYELVTSWRYWQGVRWEALLRGDRQRWRYLGQLRHAAAELAFKKQQLLHLGEKDSTRQEVEQYRQRLSELEARPFTPAS